jgi:AAA domain
MSGDLWPQIRQSAAEAAARNGHATQPDGKEPALLAVQPAGTKPARPRPETLVDGLLQQGELLVLGAARGIGKSWWGMDLARQLAQGAGRVMGAFTVRRPARVLYCHGEIDEWTAYDRWERLRGDDPLPEGLTETFERWRIRVVTTRVVTGFTSTEFAEAILDGRLEQTLVLHQVEVLVIDPWAVFYAGRENSNDEVEAALDTLRDLQLRHGLTVVILHHFGKATEGRDPEDLWRGASRLADWASTRITLTPYYTPTQVKAQGMTRHQARLYAEAKFLRRTAASPDDLAIRWNPETGYWERWRAPDPESTPAGLNAVDVAAKCPAPDGWPSVLAAAAALDVSQGTARKLLEQAKAQRLLEDFDGPRGARGWRIPGARLEGTDVLA